MSQLMAVVLLMVVGFPPDIRCSGVGTAYFYKGGEWPDMCATVSAPLTINSNTY